MPASAGAVMVGYNEDAARLLAVPTAVEQSNTQVARFSFLWQTIEPADDEFYFDEMDRVTALLRNSGIRPMISIFGSAAWADGADREPHCACDEEADPQWQEMWQEVALRYPDAILNVWNEPNLPRYGSVGTERLAELTNGAAEAIWEVDPDRIVVGAPASPAGGWQIYAGALYPKLDPRIQFAANLYPHARLVRNIRKQLRHVRRIAGERPIWITETNVSLAQVGPSRQARYAREMFQLAKERGFEGVIFHRLWSPYDLNGDVNPGTRACRRSPPTARRCGCTDGSAALHPGSKASCRRLPPPAEAESWWPTLHRRGRAIGSSSPALRAKPAFSLPSLPLGWSRG